MRTTKHVLGLALVLAIILVITTACGDWFGNSQSDNSEQGNSTLLIPQSTATPIPMPDMPSVSQNSPVGGWQLVDIITTYAHDLTDEEMRESIAEDARAWGFVFLPNNTALEISISSSPPPPSWVMENVLWAFANEIPFFDSWVSSPIGIEELTWQEGELIFPRLRGDGESAEFSVSENILTITSVDGGYEFTTVFERVDMGASNFSSTDLAGIWVLEDLYYSGLQASDVPRYLQTSDINYFEFFADGTGQISFDAIHRVHFDQFNWRWDGRYFTLVVDSWIGDDPFFLLSGSQLILFNFDGLNEMILVFGRGNGEVSTSIVSDRPAGSYYLILDQDLGLMSRWVYFRGNTVDLYQSNILIFDNFDWGYYHHQYSIGQNNHWPEFEPLVNALRDTMGDVFFNIEATGEAIDFFMESILFGTVHFVVDENAQTIRLDFENATFNETAARQGVYDFFYHDFIQSLGVELPSSAAVSEMVNLMLNQLRWQLDFEASLELGGEYLTFQYSENFDVLTDSFGDIFIRRP